MNTVLVTVALLIGILVLIVPISTKRIIYILGSLVFALGILFTLNNLGKSGKVQIKATDTHNESALGSEVWLKEVIVNGKSYAPSDYFGDGWINEEGFLKWRNYDAPDGLNDTIYAEFKSGDSVQLVFDSNKWRGIVRVISWNGDQAMDCYSDTESSENSMYFDLHTVETGIIFSSSKIIIISVWAVLVILGLVLRFLRARGIIKSNVENKKVKNRIIVLDILKIISAYMIIIIHVSGTIYSTYEIGSRSWLGGLFLNTISRFAVPMFVMISGILMLKKEEVSIKGSIKKALKALSALIFWSLLYIIIRYIYYGEGDIIGDSLVLLFKRGPSGHLWYGYLLIWIYLFVPILSVLYHKLDKTKKLYFVLIALVVPSIMDTFSTMFEIGGFKMLVAYYTNIHLGYIGMMFLGAYLFEYKSISRLLGFILAILGFSITFILSSYFSLKSQTAQFGLFDETMFGNVLLATGILSFALSFPLKYSIGGFLNKIVKLSELSLGVYFSHVLFMWIMGTEIQIGSLVLNASTSAVSAVILAFVYYIFSAFTMWSFGMIPGLKKFVKF